MTPETPTPPISKRRRVTAAGVLTIAVLSFAAGGFIIQHTDAQAKTGFLQTAAATATAQAARPGAVQAGTPRYVEQGMPFSFANLVEHVSPAVVTVLVDREERVARNTNMQDVPAPFRDFFRQFGQGQGQGQGQDGQPQVQRGQAMGSGFIVDPNGYIVTNNHVIDAEKKISVKLPDGREFEAKVVGADEATDVALLKIDNVKNLPTVAFGDDSHLRVGDWVVAVGNPFGLGGTVTAGIVSSLGRDIGNGPYTDYIQIDAPINQGNSGGPTFDLSGRVVGMNSAIYSPSGGSVGIGFAIPASTIQETIDQLREHGSVARGWLGVQIQNLTPELASSVGATGAKGAIVADVVDNSPAQKAGFHQGDVILAIDGKDVTDSRDLTRRVGTIRAGDKANFTVLRDGAKRSIPVTIEKRDEQRVASAEQTPGGGAGDAPAAATTSLGLSLLPISPAARERFNLDKDVNGVVVASVDPDSEAAGKGFRPGDVIVGVGNKEVHAPADVARGIADAKGAGRDSVLFLVAGEQGQHFVALKVAKG